MREKCPTAENTPASKDELKEELKVLSKELKVFDVLIGVSTGFNLGEKRLQEHPDTIAYLLVLNIKEHNVNVTAYNKKELLTANERYMEIEKENQNNPNTIAVLVAVESLRALKIAYPNYYLDSKEFIKALNEAIE